MKLRIEEAKNITSLAVWDKELSDKVWHDAHIFYEKKLSRKAFRTYDTEKIKKAEGYYPKSYNPKPESYRKSHNEYPADLSDDRWVIKDGKLYVNPCVRVDLNNCNFYVYLYFKTFEEAKKHAIELSKKCFDCPVELKDHN
ncbi:hypothetical protein KAR91_46270 [Candidatus Pacearchaeota archaeon]|nr:hypothetical protein [Candidatus Pacearchaeota archaeon]